MRVLLQRNLFADGARYRVQSGGTEIPDHIELPPDAKIWDGKEFVALPDDQRKRDALVKKSSDAVSKEAEAAADEEPDPNTFRVYNPSTKSPNAKEPIQGTVALTGDERRAEYEREKREQRQERARIAREDAEGAPPKDDNEKWSGEGPLPDKPDTIVKKK